MAEQLQAGYERADAIQAKVMKYAPYITIVAMIVYLMLSMTVFAENSPNDTAKNAFDIVFDVGQSICIVLGVIFLFAGILRYVIAHTNDSGPDMQKAAQMIATGIILTGIGAIIGADSFKKLIDLPTATNS